MVKMGLGPCDICGKPGRWGKTVVGCSEHKAELGAVPAQPGAVETCADCGRIIIKDAAQLCGCTVIVTGSIDSGTPLDDSRPAAPPEPKGSEGEG